MTGQGLAKVEHGESYIVGVDDAISPARLLEQVTLIQNVMKSVMKDGEHFGKIPGCGDKPTLLKPGAEKLCFTFRMDPQFDIEVIDMGKGHREYRVKCTLYSIGGGQRLGSGVGSASTMEGKWRFRTGPKELTDQPVPKAYWDNRESDPKKALEAIGGKGHSVGKGEDGRWYIGVAGEKVEHDNPADVYNTVLKMGKKRAMVDAVLTCTAASDIFTQDVEELIDNGVIVPAATTPPPAASTGTTPPATEPPKQAAPPPAEGEKKDLHTLINELQQLAEIAVDAGLYPNDGDAIYEWTKFVAKKGANAGKESGFRNVSMLKFDWQATAAIEKANAQLNTANPPTDPGGDEDPFPVE